MARPRLGLNLDLNLNLSRRQKLAVKIAGYTLLAITTFLITLHIAFPYEQLRGKVVEVLRSKYDVTIESVGRGLLPGQVVFEKIVLRSRPTQPDDKPTELIIDRLELDLGLDFNILGAIRRKVALDFEAEVGAGEIEGELDLSKSLVEVKVATQSLPLETVPGLATAVGLPMTGGLDADMEIRLPGRKWKNAEGYIDLECQGCTIGDGVAKLTLSSRRSRRRSSAWDAEARSITVPRLSLGTATAEIDISAGIGKIKKLEAASKDGWLKITGQIEFQDPFSSSLFPGCMQFKLSDDLKKREPNFGNIEYGISEKLRQADGSYSIPTRGKLTAIKWDPRRRCGGGATDDDDDRPPALAGRPALTPEEPDEPAEPAPGGTAVDPATVPGVSNAEVPPPGGSGPALTPTTPRDAGAGAPATAEKRGDDGEADRDAEDREDGRDGERGDDERGDDDRGDGDRDRGQARYEDEGSGERDDRDPEDRDGRGMTDEEAPPDDGAGAVVD